MSSLAKERMSHNSFPYGSDQYHILDMEKSTSSGYNKNLTLTHFSTLYKNPNPNSKGIIFEAATTNFNHSSEEVQSAISFKAGFNNSTTQSMFNFEQSQLHNYQWNQNINSPHFQAVNSSNYSCRNTGAKDMINHNIEDHESNGNWFYTEATVVTNSFEKSAIQDSSGNHKRSSNYKEESTQAFKKQCSDSGNKNKAKPKSSTQATSKDSQSIVAKNRRERISERLKVLQELVPNGSKVDLVTMLEKAISYVKFLQLQVKVLATNEFWPVQGGKPPDICQVKEAIDAIVLNSSQRDTRT